MLLMTLPYSINSVLTVSRSLSHLLIPIKTFLLNISCMTNEHFETEFLMLLAKPSPPTVFPISNENSIQPSAQAQNLNITLTLLFLSQQQRYSIVCTSKQQKNPDTPGHVHHLHSSKQSSPRRSEERAAWSYILGIPQHIHVSESLRNGRDHLQRE